jgi:hypothetical protein
MTYDPAQGFSLENYLAIDGEKLPVRLFVGEYVPAKNSYNYYPINDEAAKTIGGLVRSNIRLEIRSSGRNLLVVETYTVRDN